MYLFQISMNKNNLNFFMLLRDLKKQKEVKNKW